MLRNLSDLQMTSCRCERQKVIRTGRFVVWFSDSRISYELCIDTWTACPISTGAKSSRFSKFVYLLFSGLRGDNSETLHSFGFSVSF